MDEPAQVLSSTEDSQIPYNGIKIIFLMRTKMKIREGIGILYITC